MNHTTPPATEPDYRQTITIPAPIYHALCAERSVTGAPLAHIIREALAAWVKRADNPLLIAHRAFQEAPKGSLDDPPD